MLHMGSMIYETKTALILRADLAAWQLANIAAFLAGGLAGIHVDYQHVHRHMLIINMYFDFAPEAALPSPKAGLGSGTVHG